MVLRLKARRPCGNHHSGFAQETQVQGLPTLWRNLVWCHWAAASSGKHISFWKHRALMFPQHRFLGAQFGFTDLDWDQICEVGAFKCIRYNSCLLPPLSKIWSRDLACSPLVWHLPWFGFRMSPMNARSRALCCCFVLVCSQWAVTLSGPFRAYVGQFRESPLCGWYTKGLSLEALFSKCHAKVIYLWLFLSSLIWKSADWVSRAVNTGVVETMLAPLVSRVQYSWVIALLASRVSAVQTISVFSFIFYHNHQANMLGCQSCPVGPYAGVFLHCICKWSCSFLFAFTGCSWEVLCFVAFSASFLSCWASLMLYTIHSMPPANLLFLCICYILLS